MWARRKGSTALIWTSELYSAINKNKKNAGAYKKNGWRKQSHCFILLQIPHLFNQIQESPAAFPWSTHYNSHQTIQCRHKAFFPHCVWRIVPDCHTACKAPKDSLLILQKQHCYLREFWEIYDFWKLYNPEKTVISHYTNRRKQNQRNKKRMSNKAGYYI